MQRNLAQSLFEHGQVRTTLYKAKDLRPFAERLITLAKKSREGSIAARRQIHKLLGDRSLIPEDHRETYEMMSDAKRNRTLRAPSGRRHRTGDPKGKLTFTGETVTHRLIEGLAPKYADRDGGYTRLIRLADRRIGDHSPLAVVQLVGDETGPGSLAKRRKTARRKRADARYAAAIKASKGVAGKQRGAEARTEDQSAGPEAQDAGNVAEGGQSEPEQQDSDTPA